MGEEEEEEEDERALRAYQHVLSDVCESCDETRVIIDWLITHQFDSE